MDVLIPARESQSVEFKSALTNSFLKTVSAFANYGDGDIYFGVKDDGTVCGVEALDDVALKIEGKINDTITPRPSYTMSVLDGRIIALHIHEGPDKPYTYQGKAYRRGDTSTVEVDRQELQRLFISGVQRSFDSLKSSTQNLTFNGLEEALQTHVGISKLTEDTLKTLDLYSATDGYNNAAALLADNHEFPGLDIARFGDSQDQIRERHVLAGQSVLGQIDDAVAYFKQHYTYEVVSDVQRSSVEMIPIVAFREALANALVHRSWEILAAVQVEMHPDRVVVSSPGGLPYGITAKEYENGFISVLRNPILAAVLFRLGYIEKFGTGISRIKQNYRGALVQPQFIVTDSVVQVILPVRESQVELSDAATQVIAAINGDEVSRAQLELATGLSKATITRALRELEKAHVLVRVGKGPATRYHRQGLL